MLEQRFDRKPLVSILIPNFNHARYLDESIQSALAQTYTNKEVILLDNVSTDNSLEIAAKYQRHGLRICRNCRNILNRTYRVLSDSLATGDFLLLLGADDTIHPRFIEKAVDLMLRYPSVGYVHCERDFMREDGSLVELDFFFDRSFIAPGEEVMPIYMLTTIAHPAQGVIRRSAFDRIGGYEMEIDHMNSDKSLWFYLSSVSDYGYIREKMCRIRISNNNETAVTQQNFQHPLLCHLTVNDFCRFAEQFKFPKVLERKGEALQRLARDFLLYAENAINTGSLANGSAYLTYARIVDRSITSTASWQRLKALHDGKAPESGNTSSLSAMYEARPRNYPPPEGFVNIETGTL